MFFQEDFFPLGKDHFFLTLLTTGEAVIHGRDSHQQDSVPKEVAKQHSKRKQKIQR